MAFSGWITTSRDGPDRHSAHRRTTPLALERDVLIVACAISAGVHGALIREHFEEGAGAGGGFLASTILLIALVVALTRAGGTLVLLASVAVLASLIVAYGFAVSTGVPILHPEVEPVEGLALSTKVVEVVGLVAALDLLRAWGDGPHLHLYERTTT